MLGNFTSRLLSWFKTPLIFVGRLFSDPQVYLEWLTRPWSHAIGLFLCLVGLISGLSALQLVHQWGAQLLRMPQAISDEWISNYPPNQVIQWQDNTLSVQPNSTQPTIIPWPAGLAELKWPGPLAIYDPNSDSQPIELVKNLPHEPLFIVNQKQVWTNSSDKKWTRSFALTELPLLSEGNRTWDKTAVISLLGEWVAQLRHWVKTGLVLFPFLSILFSWWTRAWFVVIEGTLLWAISQLIGWRLNWLKLVKLALLLVPTAEVIGWLGHLLYPQLTWSLFQPAFWLLMGFMTLRFSNHFSNPNPKSPTP